VDVTFMDHSRLGGEQLEFGDDVVPISAGTTHSFWDDLRKVTPEFCILNMGCRFEFT